MVFVRASLASFALFALSTAQAQDAGGWVDVNVTEANSEVLYTALRDVSTYGPDVNTFACAYGVNSLQVKEDPIPSNGEAPGTDYNFAAGGCVLDSSADVGACPEVFACSNEANLNIYVFSQPDKNILRVTSITRVDENFNVDNGDKTEVVYASAEN